MIKVYGDIMLDRWIIGKADRVSPEADVLILNEHHQTFNLGGAANLAINLKNINVDIELYGAIGTDKEGIKVLKLLENNWAEPHLSAGIAQHKPGTDGINFIDVRSIEPQKGRRVDADQKAVIVVYEESNNITHPTIDWGVRNEEYTFTIHLRVLHQPSWGELTFSRDRLQSLYQITRYIIEKNGLRPKVYSNGEPSIDYSNDSKNTSTVEESAELIQITGRNEANDRGKRLLGYKMSVTMKRFGRAT